MKSNILNNNAQHNIKNSQQKVSSDKLKNHDNIKQDISQFKMQQE